MPGSAITWLVITCILSLTIASSGALVGAQAKRRAEAASLRTDRYLSEVAQVHSGKELILALIDPAVSSAVIASPAVRLDVDLIIYLSQSHNLTFPINITRNVSFYGDPALPVRPTVTVMAVPDVFRLAAGCIMEAWNVILSGVRDEFSLNQTPGLSLFSQTDATDPASMPRFYLRNSTILFPACFDAKTLVGYINNLRTPIPGDVNNVTMDLSQDGCVNDTSKPVQDRCWALKGFFFTFSSKVSLPTPTPVGVINNNNNMTLLFTNISTYCRLVVDAECIAKHANNSLQCFWGLVKIAARELEGSSEGGGNVSSWTGPPSNGINHSKGVGGGSSEHSTTGIVVGATLGAAVLTVLITLIIVSRTRSIMSRRQHKFTVPPADGSIGAPTAIATGQTDSDDTVPVAISGAKSSIKNEVGCTVSATWDRALDGCSRNPSTCTAASAGGAASRQQTPKAAAAVGKVTPVNSAGGVAAAATTDGGVGAGSGGSGSSSAADTASRKQQRKAAAALALLSNQGAAVAAAGLHLSLVSPDMPSRPSLEVDVTLLEEGPSAELRPVAEDEDEDDDCGRQQAKPIALEAQEATTAATASAAEPGVVVVQTTSRVLGKGSFGRVVEGMYGNQRVAVKMLADLFQASGSDNPASSTILQSFQYDLQVLSRCRHPNIVSLLAACAKPPRLCLVMELMDTSLDKVLHGKHSSGGLMPLPKVLFIAGEVAQALAYLHPTVCHRDLKPANVLVRNFASDRPEIKLADFGLSRLRSTVVPTQNPDAGTPPYMAPECFDISNTGVVSHKADIYSLGVLLWEMLAGRRPWPNALAVAIAVAVAMNQRRLPLDAIPPDRLPPKLARLLTQCWDADPLRRPAADEVAKELAFVSETLDGEENV